MRVIAGKAKGTPLRPVPGDSTRPISDRVKEALFAILGDALAGARVLDLFAGTGGVGIEALSRGAASAVFVELRPQALSVIRANLAATGLRTQARVTRADVFRYLEGTSGTFDLIYVAPPQYQRLWARALLSLDSKPGWLASTGQVIVQLFPKEFEQLPLSSLALVDRRKYGSTLLAFYQPLPGDRAG